MKHTLPEKSTTKLPKKYWFTLILMWIVCIYIMNNLKQVNISTIHTMHILTFSAFCSFLLLHWLTFYFVNHFLEEVNLIVFHTVVFYIILIFIPIISIQFFGFGDFYLFPILPEYRNFLRQTAGNIHEYFILLFIYLAFYTTFFILFKKIKHINTPKELFTKFIIFWCEMFAITFPIIGIYTFNTQYYNFYW